MRRIILLLPTLLFVTGVLAACRPGEPRITVDTAQIDFGDVPNGQIAARDLVVRNEGDGLLVVDKIATSCGCTSASLEPMRLGPGEQGRLAIAYDSGAHGPDLRGVQTRQVFLTSNDPAQPELVVELTVNVTAPVERN